MSSHFCSDWAAARLAGPPAAFVASITFRTISSSLAQRWFHDLHHSQSPDEVRGFHDDCRRPPYVVALADRVWITIPMPSGAVHGAQGWRLEWAKSLVAEARAQLAFGAVLAVAIVSRLRLRA